jgi:hypothetical protein
MVTLIGEIYPIDDMMATNGSFWHFQSSSNGSFWQKGNTTRWVLSATH